MVVGDALLDVRVVPTAPIAQGSDVPATIRLVPGGQGANVAVRLARRGVEVTLVCALGDDAAGALVRGRLTEDDVRLAPISTVATGTVVVLREPDGERTMLSDRAPIGRLPTLPSGDWLVVSGYLLLEPDAQAVAATLATAPMRRVLLGCAVPDGSLARWRAAMRALRPDLVVANRQEAARLWPDETGAVRVATDPEGAELVQGDVRIRADARLVTPVVDTTGAGDAFAAGLVAALAASGWPPTEPVLRDAMRAAVTLAASVARVPGAQAPVPGERPATLRP